MASKTVAVLGVLAAFAGCRKSVGERLGKMENASSRLKEAWSGFLIRASHQINDFARLVRRDGSVQGYFSVRIGLLQTIRILVNQQCGNVLVGTMLSSNVNRYLSLGICHIRSFGVGIENGRDNVKLVAWQNLMERQVTRGILVPNATWKGINKARNHRAAHCRGVTTTGKMDGQFIARSHFFLCRLGENDQQTLDKFRQAGSRTMLQCRVKRQVRVTRPFLLGKKSLDRAAVQQLCDRTEIIAMLLDLLV
mmetsp:Transcript_20994/g.58115  ORF Transcript_20994/g.58115 Transcript_20994/m.58115 type:complete len:251 (-) Transcript_20994:156-908(-)